MGLYPKGGILAVSLLIFHLSKIKEGSVGVSDRPGTLSEINQDFLCNSVILY